ncbi:DUF2231 domain-containing protein [Desulfospira joergensenii]|uniref:DUF2231 domain-containing protein n=1 Tax=Desulfospira joergensenii TaxID=53329 RepID=UPI0003B475C2|nr:DUF2231 domain-containing protein [Desulfospira joergensenii]
MTELTEIIFGFLNKVGFIHPIHPAMTHIPMGMTMGAFVFRFASFLPKLKMLAKTGYHCIILGLLGIAPTVFAGLLDWQHRYEGQWEALIILKMVLAGLLTVVMLFVVIKDDPENARFDKITACYLLMLVLSIGLGYSGGELQYG